MGTLSYNGPNPATVRVFDVTNTQFSVAIQEWTYLDTVHTTETISYMVAEAGNWVCPNDDCHYVAGNLLVKDRWNHVAYHETLTDPVVFS